MGSNSFPHGSATRREIRNAFWHFATGQQENKRAIRENRHLLHSPHATSAGKARAASLLRHAADDGEGAASCTPWHSTARVSARPRTYARYSRGLGMNYSSSPSQAPQSLQHAKQPSGAHAATTCYTPRWAWMSQFFYTRCPRKCIALLKLHSVSDFSLQFKSHVTWMEKGSNLSMYRKR